MGILYWFESIRIPVLNEFMLMITQLGEETAFLVVALILFWCVDKKSGYYTMAVGFIGTVANQFMKLLFRVPRPWVLDEKFTILEQAREAASGYSFPSGHTQNAVGTFSVVARVVKHKWLKIAAIAVAVLVPISRMYIGVHTPQDVVVAAAIAIALVFVLRPIIYSKNERNIPILLGVMIAMSVAFLCYVELYPFPADIDVHNLESGTKNAYTLLGSLVGLLIVYIVDTKWLNFSTKAVWWVQIQKVAVGLLLVLLVKSGLKDPLNLLLGESLGRAARYCVIVLTAGIIWPISFRFFQKLENKVK